MRHPRASAHAGTLAKDRGSGGPVVLRRPQKVRDKTVQQCEIDRFEGVVIEARFGTAFAIFFLSVTGERDQQAVLMERLWRRRATTS